MSDSCGASEKEMEEMNNQNADEGEDLRSWGRISVRWSVCFEDDGSLSESCNFIYLASVPVLRTHFPSLDSVTYHIRQE